MNLLDEELHLKKPRFCIEAYLRMFPHCSNQWPKGSVLSALFLKLLESERRDANSHSPSIKATCQAKKHQLLF